MNEGAASPPPSSARDLASDEILRDGGAVRVRAVRADDADRIQSHFRRLSTRSIYLRYFNQRRELPAAEIERMTHVDHVGRVTLLAVERREAVEDVIGIGLYEPVDGRPGRAEVAFSVLDEHHGRGIGTVLLEHLARIARRHGIDEFQATVLGENRKMLEVFAFSGFEVDRSIEDGVFCVRFPTHETLESFEAAFERRVEATTASVGRGLPAPREPARGPSPGSEE